MRHFKQRRYLLLLGIPTVGLLTTFSFAAGRSLSLREAVELALSDQGNAQVRLAEQAVEESRSRAAEVRSGLLPHVDGYVSQRRQTNNLEALGLRADRGIPLPRLVGPFSTFDARGELNQVLFDWSLFERFRSAKQAVRTAELAGEDTRDSIAAATASAYFVVLRDQKRLETALANRNLARDLLDLAQHQKEVGTGIAVEVTRAEVSLAQQQQAYLAAVEAHSSSLLRLKRWLGLDLDQEVLLTSGLERPGEESIPDEGVALQRAIESRRDLQTQMSRVEAAERSYSAAKAERYPALVGFADYGTVGPDVGSSIPTWAAGLSVQIPLFDGGAMDARRGEAWVGIRRERTKAEDLRQQIGLEVRLALSALRLARDQLVVADQGRELAQRELQEAERRYRAGVTTSLEVTEAQTHLTAADESRISALYRYNLSRIQLSDSMGTLMNDLNP